MGGRAQQRLACEAMDGSRASSHDGSDAALAARGRGNCDVGNLNGLLVEDRRMRGASATAGRRGLYADPLFVRGVTPMDAVEELLLNVVGELEAEGVVLVALLLANVASVGPGRLGVGVGADGKTRVVVGGVTAGGQQRSLRVCVADVVAVVVAVVAVVVGTEWQGAERNVGRETRRRWVWNFA